MALDSRNKRSSAVLVSLPWRGMLPAPDDSLNQGDRQQVAFLFRGDTDTTPVTPVTPTKPNGGGGRHYRRYQDYQPERRQGRRRKRETLPRPVVQAVEFRQFTPLPDYDLAGVEAYAQQLRELALRIEMEDEDAILALLIGQ